MIYKNSNHNFYVEEINIIDISSLNEVVSSHLFNTEDFEKVQVNFLTKEDRVGHGPRIKIKAGNDYSDCTFQMDPKSGIIEPIGGRGDFSSKDYSKLQDLCQDICYACKDLIVKVWKGSEQKYQDMLKASSYSVGRCKDVKKRKEIVEDYKSGRKKFNLQ